MLQIRLRRDPSSVGGVALKQLPAETVTVACPDHLVLADLPVAKGIGAATSASFVKTVGRRSRRQLGERVHFCVRCDFPIAIYGRLSPCEHVFCLDCARSDSLCYLCDERIQKIETIKMMVGIFICAAPHCLKSFLKKSDFESHIHESHADLLHPNPEKEDGKESEAQSAKQSTGSESTQRVPIRSQGMNSTHYSQEDKSRRQQPRDQLPPRPTMQPNAPYQVQNYPPEPQLDSAVPPGFDRPTMHNQFQQGFERHGTPQQESRYFSDKQQGFPPDNQHLDYPPMHPMQPPNFGVPMTSNPGFASPFGAPFPTDGALPFYGAPYETSRPNSAQDTGQEQGSLLGYPPGPVGGMNYPAPYPQPWNVGPPSMPFEGQPVGQVAQDGPANYQGDYGRSPRRLPMGMQGGSSIDPRDGKGVLAPQPMQAPPPLGPLPQPW